MTSSGTWEGSYGTKSHGGGCCSMIASRSSSVTIPVKGLELRSRCPSSDSSSRIVRISDQGRINICFHSRLA